MGYRLVAVDVDGTLLRSDGTVSTRTRQALAQAVERGLTLVVATGRRRQRSLPITDQLELPHYLVCSQGAVTWRGEELLTHSHLPSANARSALEILREHDMACVVLGNALHEDDVWVFGNWRANPRLTRYVKGAVAGTVPTIREFSDEALIHDPIQLITMDEIDRLEVLNEALTGHELPSPRPDPPAQPGPPQQFPLWRVIFSRNQFTTGGAIEVVGPTTSKAEALDQLGARLDIAPEEMVAFGDNINDVEMLRLVGVGIAMANGTDDAIAASKRRCPSNDEDGIAVALQELGII